jgi:hypothetical protein
MLRMAAGGAGGTAVLVFRPAALLVAVVLVVFALEATFWLFVLVVMMLDLLKVSVVRGAPDRRHQVGR